MIKDRAAAFFRQDHEERIKSWFLMGTKTKPIKNNQLAEPKYYP
jgi:hypothetical protein